jgi:hypothetical protein
LSAENNPHRGVIIGRSFEIVHHAHVHIHLPGVMRSFA